MYKLFYYPRNASWAPHMLLEEIGATYELVLVDRKSEEQKSSEYLKLNPTGRIPTLAYGDSVIFESAAICLHLCDEHPQSSVIPDIGDPSRPEFYQWLFYLTTSIQPELMLYFYPNKHTSSVDTAESISETQEKRITEMFGLVDKQLENKEFLIGNRLSVCDFFLFMLSHWASGFKTPPLSFEHLGRYLKDLAKRSSVKNVCEVEGTNLDAYTQTN
ncbi:glutathione S-transferase family protein [Enterovibrio makurazakiensis]|uniref:Glutathione S-transferase family protein n=1 Tax=Enterovibrio gelatinilyticus TaxID=2899819 RepID=A0ABT5R2D3_9GAMM|nr:glutathione S-transferase family protein [Enterovibrio sp. ZSDZ42]MDD1794434.1 glutathione S-transferase family protein [Enterovibrio sp. ZSDZ42]